MVLPATAITANMGAITAKAQAVAPTMSSPPKPSMESPNLMSRAVLPPPNRTTSLSQPKSPSASAGTTAQDLLNNVMGFGASRHGLRTGGGPMVSPRLSSGVISSPPPPLLFGGSQNAPVSIWSTSLDQGPVQHHFHTPSQPAVNAMTLGAENSVGVNGQNQPHNHVHSHSLPMSSPGAGLTPMWPPSLGTLRNGNANDRTPQRPLGMNDGPAEPISSPPVYQPALHDDPFMRPISHSPAFPQSFQTLRGPGPSHQRSLSLSMSGSPQVIHQSAAIPSHGAPGLLGVSIGGTAAGLGPLSASTVNPGGISSSINSGGPLGVPGHSGLSPYPGTIGRAPGRADPAIAFASGPSLTTMPGSVASASQFDAFSNESSSARQQYLRPGHYPSRSISSRLWGANV